MKAYCKIKLVTYSVTAFSLLSLCLPASAYVLDDFHTALTGWAVDANPGSATSASGVFTITTAAAAGAVKSAIKTASPTQIAIGGQTTFFTNAVGDALEFKVDVNNNFDPAGDTSTLAVLAWVPSSPQGTVLANGYALLVGANDVIIQKDGATLYATNFGGASVIATNITMRLRITPSAGSVTIDASVYQQVGSPALPNLGVGLAGKAELLGTLLFHQEVTDASASLVNAVGNAALAVKSQTNPSGASLIFDNLQGFDILIRVLDNFNANPTLAGWLPFTSGDPRDFNIVTNGNAARCEGHYVPSIGAGFAGLVYAARSFVLTDGGRIEIQVDVNSNNGFAVADSSASPRHSYSVIGFTPATGDNAIANLKQLIEYHLSEDDQNIYNGKTYGNWWGYSAPGFVNPPIANFPSKQFRLTLIMTAEGPGFPAFGATSGCRIESIQEDLSKAINDPDRIYYHEMRLDTIGADPNVPGTGQPSEAPSSVRPPFVGLPGSVAIDVFTDNSTVAADIEFDNLFVNYTAEPNQPPIIIGLAPKAGSNFVSSASSITAEVFDDNDVIANNVTLTLNGVSYNTTSNGVGGVTFTLNPPGGSAVHRTLTVSGVLAANTVYSGTLVAVDGSGSSVSSTVLFDTFAPTTFVVESEEYNFTNEGNATFPSGYFFIDNPTVEPEAASADTCYNGQVGRPEIDFHSHRGTGANGGYDAEHTVRWFDSQRTAFSTDFQRAKYANAPGNPTHQPPTGGIGGFNEEAVLDINDGDWLNYTKTYPAGYFKVFLRQAQSFASYAVVTLDQVTSDANLPNQTTTPLGSFVDTVNGGGGSFHNVPLADGFGNPIVLHLAGGQQTLRISQRLTGNSDTSSGVLEQNYFAFVPAGNPGTLRPLVSAVSPAPGSFNQGNNIGNGGRIAATSLTIANRDTAVDSASIHLTLNGIEVPVTKTSLASGVKVDWSLTDTPGAPLITAVVRYTDVTVGPFIGGVSQTNTWSYSYPFLAASNSLPVGSLTARGFDYKMVQTATVTAPESLQTAEQQLSGQIPEDQSYITNAPNGIQVIAYNNDTANPRDVYGLTGVIGTPAPLDYIVTEQRGYMHLKAGGHRFYEFSDDGFQLRSGTTPSDLNATVIGQSDGDTFNGYLDFVVEAEGLYPVRFLWYERTGGAYCFLYSVNPSDNSQVLINDPANPSGVVEVYLADGPLAQVLSCLSSSTANGTYTVDNSAVIDTNAKTVTVPQSGSAKFYRLRAGTGSHFTQIKKVGSSIVMTYAQP